MPHSWITKQFPDDLRAKGYTDAQLQEIIEALARDPGMVALVEMARMDRGDRRVRG